MPDQGSNPAIPLPPPTEAEQAALDWFARCDRGLTAEQETSFQAWLAADARHAALFNELAGTWNLLDRASAAAVLAPPAAATAVPVRRPRHARRAWVLSLAVAAAVALVYISYWRPQHYAGQTVTKVGEQRTMELPDGSVVTLNTNSSVTTAFSPQERRVRLERGEASFAVAKNSARPFIVEAGGVAVRAVGTAFNVRLADRSIEVLVLEGRVQVNDAHSGASLLAVSDPLARELPVLTPGQRAVVALPEPLPRAAPAVTEVSVLPPQELQRRTAWQEGRLDFESAPLSEIVAEFNRYHTRKLAIADPDLAAQHFGGSFKPDDQTGFVRMLQQNFGVVVEQTEDVTLLRAGH